MDQKENRKYMEGMGNTENANDMDQKEIMTDLKARLQELGLEVSEASAEEQEKGVLLRTLLPLPESGEQVLTEFVLIWLEGGSMILQIYTTILLDLPEKVYEVLGQWMLDLNFFCPFGSFGIFTEEGHFYHKYNLITDIEKFGEKEEQREQLSRILGLIQRLIEKKLPELQELLEQSFG